MLVSGRVEKIGLQDESSLPFPPNVICVSELSKMNKAKAKLGTI